MSAMPRRRATLASLAAELKVSRTTISNAYNRPDQLSDALRERVLATAKRLGYPGPDPVARSLRTRWAGAVGLMITEPLTYSFSDPAALDFVAGLAESCEEFGQGLLLVAVGPNRDVADGTASVLAAGVDGFVVYSACDDDPYLQVVLQRRLPVSEHVPRRWLVVRDGRREVTPMLLCLVAIMLADKATFFPESKLAANQLELCRLRRVEIVRRFLEISARIGHFPA